MNKIGLDGDVSEQELRGKIIPFFKDQLKDSLPTPALDVGSGDSWNRWQVISLLDAPAQICTSAVDLDECVYGYEDAYFRTVTSFEVLEHLYNPLFHLKEIRRLLHPRGMLYLTTPNDYSLIYKYEHVLSRKYRPHFHQFSERDLRDIFERANLKIVELKKFFRSNSGTLARISRNSFFVKATK